MVNTEREAVWQERVAHWRASGLSQRAFALREGYPVRQMGYWVRRLRGSPAAPGLLPVRVAPASPVPVAIRLVNERGWTLSLPNDVPSSWLAELLRAL
ncbi:IS66 family insertion sequence element accessory protein TnpA [Pseudoduganella sp. UC29_71]|uniref:IS66 family insertion sequence element accessory protein TnpA n=1 Tax=Pseudoduganella sp. UC29_71 TaxID=3350174 RepID=UPI00366E6126